MFEKRGSETEYCEMFALLYRVGANVRQDGTPVPFTIRVYH